MSEEVTIIMCLQDSGAFRQVLVAEHQRGPGVGKTNFPGGKFEEGDSPESCAARELLTESCLKADICDLEKVAFIDFSFEGKLRFSAHVLTLLHWKGHPTDTEEMKRHHWCIPDHLPWKKMWRADREWVPLVIAGLKIVARVDFNFDGTKVKSFGYRTVTTF